jgi:hypothetical protein
MPKASVKGARVTEALAEHGRAGQALADALLAKPVSEKGLLRRMFRLARGPKLTVQERADLVSTIDKRLVGAFDEIARSGVPLGPKDFGVASTKELAEMFVKEMEDMNISPKTFRAFISHTRVEGYHSRIRGRLFHLYVRNLRPLQDDFLRWALAQIEELNVRPLAGTPGSPNAKAPALVNALGQPITKSIQFDRLPFKVEKVYIKKANGQKVEFIDDAYVAFSGTGDARYMSFLNETEVKTVAAAKGLSEQIASAQIRVGSADTSLVVVSGRRGVNRGGRIVFEGEEELIEVKPEQIVYSPRSINRSGVTLFSAPRWARMKEKGEVDLTKVYEASDFSFRSTAKGMGETYLFIRLAINTDELNKIVRAILPGPPKK